MYRNAFQGKFVTVFYSCGSNPLGIWETHTRNGYISRFMDPELKSMVLEIGGSNVSTTYMVCPKGKKVLGITMPFLIMIVKNMKKYFSFEVTILDETGTRRRFRVSNFQSSTSIQPLSTAMPIGLSEGWNQILFNLSEFTNRAYKKQFVEVQKIKINANIRLRRIYFSACLFPEEELPAEYKLYFPLGTKGRKKVADANKEKENKALNVKPATDLARLSVDSAFSVMEEEKSAETIQPPSRTSINRLLSRESRQQSATKLAEIRESQISAVCEEIYVEQTEKEKSGEAVVEEPETEIITQGDEIVIQTDETIPNEPEKPVEDATGTGMLTEPPLISNAAEPVALNE